MTIKSPTKDIEETFIDPLESVSRKLATKPPTYIAYLITLIGGILQIVVASSIFLGFIHSGGFTYSYTVATSYFNETPTEVPDVVNGTPIMVQIPSRSDIREVTYFNFDPFIIAFLFLIFWFLIAGLISIWASTKMKKDNKKSVETGGKIALISGILTFNLVVMAGATVALVMAKKAKNRKGK